MDDRLRIDGYHRLLSSDSPPDLANSTEREKRLLRMLTASLLGKVAAKGTSLQEGVAILWEHPQVRAELSELLGVLAGRIEHVAIHLSSHTEVPLEIHAQYARVEILAAFDIGEGATAPLWQTGAYWAPQTRADLFAITLDKTSGNFSPTTRYRDYAIDLNLFHWESQSTIRADGDTGRRYQQHVGLGTTVMLFARKHSDDRAFYFLGPATYVTHEREQPMAVTWRLQHSLPGDLYTAFAAAVA